MNGNSIYAIIVTYNGALWIEKCLNSLLSELPPENIIIIDNHSLDNTVAIIKNLHPKFRLIIEKNNLGFGTANNKGIQLALEKGAEYFWLINQDAWMQKGTIQYLTTLSKSNPQFGILSPLHFNGAGDDLDNGFKSYLNKNSPALAKHLSENTKSFKEVYETTFVNAAAWLLTRECILRVGLFHSYFFHYGEDSNYCSRVLYHHLKIGICPQGKIFHDRAQRKESINLVLKDIDTVNKAFVTDINKIKNYWLLPFTGQLFNFLLLGIKKADINIWKYAFKSYFKILLNAKEINRIRKEMKSSVNY